MAENKSFGSIIRKYTLYIIIIKIIHNSKSIILTIPPYKYSSKVKND